MVRSRFTPPCGFDIATTTVESPRGLASIAYWGYRAVAHPDGSFFLHETYYDDREGILGIAREPARPCGDTTGDVEKELDLMREGLAEPPLRYTDYDASVGAPTGGNGAPSGAQGRA